LASVDWLSYVAIRRFTLDANHAWISLLAFVTAAAAVLVPTNKSIFSPERRKRRLPVIVGIGLALAIVCGALMFIKIAALTSLTRLAYTGFEMGLAIALIGSAAILVIRIVRALSEKSLIPEYKAKAGGN